MRPSRKNRRTDPALFLRLIVGGLALLAMAIYLAVALLRIAYPFELEWMEGTCVDHVSRILAGQPLYLAPSLDFVPFVYPPLFFWLSAGVAKLTGVGFLPLRLVSLLSSVGCFGLIFAMVRRQTNSAFAGIVAAGMFAACYSVAGFWYDIARVDMLCLVLLLAAIHLLQLDRGWSLHLLAGALVSLAFLAKQIALPVAAPLMLYAVAYRRWRGIVFTLSALMLSITAALTLDRLSGGWYRYYVFDLPRQHEIDRAAAVGFWTSDLLSAVPIALVGAIFYLARAHRRDRRTAFFWGAVLLGAVAASWTGRAHSGGYSNVLIPVYAILSITFALGLDAAISAALRQAQGRPAEARSHPEQRRGAARPRRRSMMLAAACLLCIAQFLRLGYDPRRQLPTTADRRAGEELVAAVRSIPGEVYAPYHGYLPTLAGKRSYAHAMAVWDVGRGRDQEAKERLLSDIIGAIRGQRFAAIIVDSDVFAQPDLETYYQRYPISLPDDVSWPVVGLRLRPQSVYLPRRAR